MLIGLAVGVDYSLFYIRRAREERRAGRDPEAALDVAAAIVGRAVLVSGLTVARPGPAHAALGDRPVFGIVTVTLIATVIGLAVLPAWSRALPQGAQFELWTADSVGEAFLNAPLALPLAVVTVLLLRGMAWSESALVALLRERGIEVVAEAEDAAGLLRKVAGHRPDLAIVDVRPPPTSTDEGVRAAIEACARHPGLGVLILSQYVEPVYTSATDDDHRRVLAVLTFLRAVG